MIDAVVPSDETLLRHHVLVRSDNPFQKHARLLQALWRESRGLPIGLHRDRPLGSRLAMPYAKETLANYVTEVVREVVRAEVMTPPANSDPLYQEPRIFEDLLSSQPLCFNLFAELQRDLAVASGVFSALLDESVDVTSIAFEYSPGRGDVRFTADGSAFDVFVRYTAAGVSRFVGIEVKYAENLDVRPARHRARYEEVADRMGVFKAEARATLRATPFEQFWRDHLLAGSLAMDRSSGFDRGTFAVVYPEGNTIVGNAVVQYGQCLRATEGFRAWTLERVLDAIAATGSAPWVAGVRARYVGE